MQQHYLILKDTFKALPGINTTVDAVIVDPPYNTANRNTKKLTGRKDRSSDFGKWDYFENNDYLTFTKKWISSIDPILKSNGNLLIFCKLEYISDIKRIYESLDFKHHATMIWHKTNPAPQIRKTGFLSSCEAILWATKGFDNKKISYTFNFSKQNEMHNFIQTPICMGRERTKHPTQKPKKILTRLVEIFTNKNDLILDCFAGSGTLAEAANELERNSINIENDKNYFKMMKDRLASLDNSDIEILKTNNDIKNLKP